MNITLGLPLYDDPKAETMLSLLHTVAGFPHELTLSMRRGPYLDWNREACVTDALAAKSDYLMFVDSDMAFPSKAVELLIDHAKGKDIIGGNYYEKRYPLVSTVKLLENGFDGKTVEAKVSNFPSEPFQVAAVATGFMCIDLKRLVDCMAPPYFAYETATRLGLERELGLGREDVAFCVRARKCGLQVWCDPTIPLMHMGVHAYGRMD